MSASDIYVVRCLRQDGDEIKRESEKSAHKDHLVPSAIEATWRRKLF